MAPKKGKSEKSANNDRKQNRPYSAIDIAANLHNKVSKTYAVKALRELHQKKKIESRVAGKQTVYHALQEESDGVSSEKLETMDKEIREIQEELAGLKESGKKVQTELATLCATPLLSDLLRDIEKLEEENESIAARLPELRGEVSNGVSPPEMAGVAKNWKLWQRHARRRAQICRDLWYKCSEVLPENMSSEELWEHLGLEGPPMN